MSDSKRGRVDGLDLLRGTAIALVLLRHAFPAPFGGAGVVGVVMFFALSGYLITGVLLNGHARDGRIDFLAFYRRRVVRLIPAMLVLVAGIVLVTLTLDPLGDRAALSRTVLFALTWTGNLPFGHASASTFHLWTLATEEQFYLLWPALVALGLARRRLGAVLTVGLAAGALVCLVTVVWLRSDPDLAYSLPTTWVGCFVIGGAARVWRDRWTPPRWTVPVDLVVLLGLSLAPLRGHAATYLLAGPLVAGLTSVLILRLRRWNSIEQRPLRLLVGLGTISYGAYLWNYPLTLWLRPTLPSAAGPLALVLTLIAAGLSWRLVEQPLMRRCARPARPTPGQVPDPPAEHKGEQRTKGRRRGTPSSPRRT